mmetsp:Transcript_12595/g.39192  ORF Transcript_12595/g.39192 Transcript_12595/m.39192 type:complete len:81 (-) Transcript_12595:449-691(-)|eukprot:CAMPEP_0174835112 /NCGR_PEP_ID=MMETSP1114-20130205/5238_1 /TAXON_ID=312471 /ORGANISM="Neobodo designis, Strain CCAP 1951/1" /LENGTH=80 /DNA_ID=CAMNT_0016069057 /DNA_START=51 /DNA_END=293 /DNA_ORIENTATION=+
MANPTVMKARGKQLDKKISQSPSEREANKRVATTKKGGKDEEGMTIGPFALGLLLFLTVGSAFLQIFQNIQTNPSMSEAP